MRNGMQLPLRSAAAAALFTACAGLAAACGAGGLGDACRTNADCEPGLYCDPATGTCISGAGTDATTPGADSDVPDTDSDVPGTDGNVPGSDSSGPGSDAAPGTDAAPPGTDSSVPCIPFDCDDGNSCTDDTCVPGTGCSNVNDDTNLCDDGSVCSVDEECMAGVCTPTLFMACFEDSNPCTTATCDPAIGCFFALDTGPCDDGDFCTVGDVCAGGACIPGGPCADADPDTYDYCDRVASACAFVPTCFQEDFEGIAPGTWSLGGDWQFVTSPELMSNGALCVASPLDHLPALEGSSVLWYGSSTFDNYSAVDVCGFGSTTLGHAESEVITVPAGIAPEIAFWEWWEIECGFPYNYDFMSIWVNIDGAGFTGALSVNNTGLQACGSGGGGGTNGLSNAGASYMAGTASTENMDGVWALRRIPLGFTTGATTTIQIRLRFNSVDGIENSFRGWTVDHLALLCP